MIIKIVGEGGDSSVNYWFCCNSTSATAIWKKRGWKKKCLQQLHHKDIPHRLLCRRQRRVKHHALPHLPPPTSPPLHLLLLLLLLEKNFNVLSLEHFCSTSSNFQVGPQRGSSRDCFWDPCGIFKNGILTGFSIIGFGILQWCFKNHLGILVGFFRVQFIKILLGSF